MASRSSGGGSEGAPSTLRNTKAARAAVRLLPFLRSDSHFVGELELCASHLGGAGGELETIRRQGALRGVAAALYSLT